MKVDKIMKIGSNLEARIFQPDYAIVVGLIPKWSPFCVPCDDVHIGLFHLISIHPLWMDSLGNLDPWT